MCCEALIKASNCLAFEVYDESDTLKSKILQGYKMIEIQKLQDEINSKNRLNELEYKFLGLDYNKIKMSNKKNNKLLWNKDNTTIVRVD